MNEKDEKQNNFELEAKYNLTAFFKLLLEIDTRNNPHIYENNGNPNNTNKSK